MVAFLNATIVFFDVFTPVFTGKYSCAFVKVTDKSGSHDQLTTGSRLYRDDGKEAVLIRVES